MTTNDLALINEAAAGNPAAAERLLRRIGDTVWRSCRVVTQDEAQAREAFSRVLSALQADGFSRLRRYDGRGRIETFTALVARDLLAQDVLDMLHADPQRGWRAFESFFQSDIRRIVARRLSGATHEEHRRDAYQDICLALVDNDCRRLKSYNGSGSFTGFVLHMVDRLAIDVGRALNPRRRLPAAIQRLPPLEQEVFRQVHWERCGIGLDVLVPAVARRLPPPAPGPAEVAAALERVTRSYDAATEGPVKIVPLPDPDDPVMTAAAVDASPEDLMLRREADHRLELAATAVRRAAASLGEAERLYLSIALSGDEPLPARAVARLMGRPVEEVYKLKQQVMKQLKETLKDDQAVKDYRASI